MKYRQAKQDKSELYAEERKQLESTDPLERRLMRGFNEFRPDINCFYGRGCIIINGFKVHLHINNYVMRLSYEGELVPFDNTMELLEYFNEHNFCKLSKSDIAYITKHAELVFNQFKQHRYERFHKTRR